MDYAEDLTFYIEGDGGTLSAAASSRNSSSASVTFNNLTEGTTYTYYAVATAKDGNKVYSQEKRFTTLKPNTTYGWLELPAKGTVSTAKEYALSVGSGSSKKRNYTAYYDTDTYSSLWVAYPLTSSHLGSGGSGTWKKAPEVNAADQVDLSLSYNDYNEVQHSRGHQIANADRNGVSEMQAQTYYSINSTPQIQNNFNSGIWSSLETGIRDAVPSGDSLYVATGPVYRTVGGSETWNYTTAKNDTKQCPIPNYYYKVVLKVKRLAGKVVDAMAVGFWLEHKVYGNSDYTSYAVPVDEIERKTGYDFFANLPNAIEASAERNSSWSVFTTF